MNRAGVAGHPLRYELGAWLFVAVVGLALFGAFVARLPMWWAGVVAWGACLLLWPRLARQQALTVLVIVILGALGIGWGTARGATGLVERGLAQNIPLVAMLIAVSALRLISVGPTAVEHLETGRGALARTLVGVHLFGLVINFSAVAIFADRLTARAKLTLAQSIALSQSFMIGALWSPFFGAMAVALTVAPEARLSRLMAVGLPLTVLGIATTYLTLASKRYDYGRDFIGYPIRFESLWVPALLAVAVLATHELRPQWSVLAVITLLAPLVAVATMLLRDGGGTGPALLRLVRLRLPEMGSEMSLFMAAGTLSAGMAGVAGALDLGVPFERFGGFEASVVLVAINLLAWAGLHPVILVSVVGPWLAPIQPDHTLLAMTFLMTWGVGLLGCPMSNTLLALYSRYGVPLREVLAHNRRYSAWLTLACIGMLNAYAALLT